MGSFEAELAKQSQQAESRVVERDPERDQKIQDIEAGGRRLAEADEPARIAARIDRLSRHFPEVRPVDPAKIAAGDDDAMRAAGAVLERIINTRDLVDVRYLEAGARAARAVARVDIRDEGSRVIGYGTGSLVSARLLLTNHHVLPDFETAARSRVEFNYQDGIDGQPLQPVAFPLDPDAFYLSDPTLDFALVAVGGADRGLRTFGFNPLIREEGKAVVGDFVTIVQHPGGDKKQVGLRDNRIVDVFDEFLHYQTDTAEGSSGAPAFNDQWEVVALHHASVPAPDHPELGKYVNEGIRVSRLVKFVEQNTPVEKRAMVKDLLAPERTVVPGATGLPGEALRGPSAFGAVTVPLEVSVRVGQDRGSQLAPAEAVRIDPDWGSRGGYDSRFLGTGPLEVPLPSLSEALIEDAAVNQMATDEDRHILPYHHFSIVQNRRRRLAFFTAVNIDGALGMRLKREKDHWFFDPRLDPDEQTGLQVYERNDLDLGHLVRRLDPAWGVSVQEAKLANDDTFHFTNCSPQHKDFNRLQTSWAGLEDYILENADNMDFKVSVFTGPVFDEDDQHFRGVQLPRQFWKVVVMVKESTGELSATSYVLSQERLIRGLEIDLEEFSYGEYRTYQVPVRRIESLTGLEFGSLVEADPLGRLEAMVPFKPIDRFEQIDL